MWIYVLSRVFIWRDLTPPPDVKLAFENTSRPTINCTSRISGNRAFIPATFTNTCTPGGRKAPTPCAGLAPQGKHKTRVYDTLFAQLKLRRHTGITPGHRNGHVCTRSGWALRRCVGLHTGSGSYTRSTGYSGSNSTVSSSRGKSGDEWRTYYLPYVSLAQTKRNDSHPVHRITLTVFVQKLAGRFDGEILRTWRLQIREKKSLSSLLGVQGDIPVENMTHDARGRGGMVEARGIKRGIDCVTWIIR